MLVIVYPLARGVQMSLLRISFLNLGLSHHAFAGVANYVAVFRDPAFWVALKNTAVWTVVNLVAQLALGLAFALLLNQKLRGQGFFRSVALIPWIVPSVVAVLTWRWMYDSANGLFNWSLLRLGLIHQPVNWLGNMSSVLWAIIAESVWKGTPFVLLLFLSALQAIPEETYEAARMDGAGNLQTLVYVVLPMIKRTLAIATILTATFTINNFNAIWLMTQGGPLHASETVLTYAYKVAFKDFNLGNAAAVSVMLFMLLSVISTFYIGLVERGERT
ncbi:MAG: carbohydrate ABC transporter permease [Bacillota bacterium]